MKKKLAATLSVVLTLGLAVLGILAYLQDDDSDVNVMTLGEVEIDQIELERIEQSDDNIGADNLQDFYGNDLGEAGGKPLYPTVGSVAWADSWQMWGTGGSNQLFTDKLKNVQDKFVFVENTGKSDAYVRTWFAFEAGDMTVEEINNDLVHWNRNTGFWKWSDFSEDMTATIEGTKYYLRVATYTGNDSVHIDGILPAGETTRPSLLQVFLDSKATNEDIAAFGDEYEILVFSQAVQTEGFDNSEVALNTAFGEVEADNHPWTETLKRPGYVYDLEDLRTALETGGEYKLGADITVESADMLYKADGGHKDGSAFFVKADSIIDLNGYDINVNTGNAWAEVFFMTWGADLTIKGEGKVSANCSIACVYDSNSVLNIENGDFKVTANNDMLYSIYGKVNVSGGTFESSYWNIINIYGSGRTQLVDVSGGSFKSWNPSTSPDGNLLADGYTVKTKEIDGATWYDVLSE